jgi:hypothetical protein
MWIGILICSVTKELKFYNPLQHFHKLPDKAIYIMASDAKNDDNLLPVHSEKRSASSEDWRIRHTPEFLPGKPTSEGESPPEHIHLILFY